MADFERMYNQLRKIVMKSACQGKSTVEEYILFKYNQTVVQKNQPQYSKPFYFFVCLDSLKKVTVRFTI